MVGSPKFTFTYLKVCRHGPMRGQIITVCQEDRQSYFVKRTDNLSLSRGQTIIVCQEDRHIICAVTRSWTNITFLSGFVTLKRENGAMLLERSPLPSASLNGVLLKRWRRFLNSKYPFVFTPNNGLFLSVLLLHGYPSRVRVGRGCVWGHLIIWAGAVRPKTAVTQKSVMDRRTDKAGCSGVACNWKKLHFHLQRRLW